MAREAVAVTSAVPYDKDMHVPTRDAGAVGYLLIVLVVLVMCCAGTAIQHYSFEYIAVTPTPPGSRLWIGLFRYRYVSCQAANQDNCDGPITDFACDNFKDYLKAASAFAILTDVFAGVTLIVLLVEVATIAKVPWVVATVLGICTWVFSLIVWALILAAFKRGFCDGASLDEQNFQLGGGWGLFLISFCILPIGIILSVLRARRIPEHPTPRPVVATNTAVVPATNAPHY